MTYKFTFSRWIINQNHTYYLNLWLDSATWSEIFIRFLYLLKAFKFGDTNTRNYFQKYTAGKLIKDEFISNYKSKYNVDT